MTYVRAVSAMCRTIINRPSFVGTPFSIGSEDSVFYSSDDDIMFLNLLIMSLYWP